MYGTMTHTCYAYILVHVRLRTSSISMYLASRYVCYLGLHLLPVMGGRPMKAPGMPETSIAGRICNLVTC
jgi:hypothetical protein